MGAQRTKSAIFYGFMLFSFFFGAGNLIFPPMLGMDAGTNFTPAAVGFILTAIALPIMTLVAIAKSPDGLMGLGRRVHPVFALIFSILIYLSIGAMYGIPRAANVGYEMGFKYLFDVSDLYGLIIYVGVFFTICYFAALHTGHLVSLIGKLLTPVLLCIIALLCILAFMYLAPKAHPPTEKFLHHPLSAGIIEGYFTMDALAALAFGSVLANAITREEGAEANIVKIMIKSALIAGLCLGVVYFCLAWIGSAMYQPDGYEHGAALLSQAATQLMGKAGNMAFGTIVMLACLTTCIGLINACSTFSKRLYPRISYPVYVLMFTIAGAVFSNLGLDRILAVAVPILVFLYPISITLVVLSLLHPIIGQRRWAYILGVGTTTLLAFSALLTSLSVELPWQPLLEQLPLASFDLGWIVPTVVMAVVGYICSPKPRLASIAKSL